MLDSSAQQAPAHHIAKMTPAQEAELEFRQAMASLYIASHYMEHPETINNSTEIY